MNNEKREKLNISNLAPLLLFGVFAVCIMTVLIFGTGSYKRLVKRDQTAYTERTVLQYVATKLRQNPDKAAVTVEQFDGCSCLVLRQKIGSITYLDRIYCYKGWVRELFAAESGNFTAADGEKVLETSGLSFSVNGDLLEIRHDSEEGYGLLQLSLSMGTEAGK